MSQLNSLLESANPYKSLQGDAEISKQMGQDRIVRRYR